MIEQYLQYLQEQEGDGQGTAGRSPLPGVAFWHKELRGAPALRRPEIRDGHFEAVFCLSGRLCVQMEPGPCVSAESGELLLLSYTARLRSVSVGEEPFEFLAVEVDKGRAKTAFLSQLSPFGSAPDIRTLRAWMDGNQGCMLLRDAPWSDSVLAGIAKLPPDRQDSYFTLRLMERLCLLSGEPPRRLLPEPERYYDSYQKEAVLRAHDYLMAHLDQPLTIQDLARNVRISTTYLKEGFRQLYGMPVHRYLRRQRLRRAAELLCTTQKSVLSIAAQVGYTGTSQFNAAFKALYGVPPTAYRRAKENKCPNQEESAGFGQNFSAEHDILKNNLDR